MNSGMRFRLLAVAIVIAALSTAACSGPDHAVAKTDANVPGELIVSRDIEDDDRGELFVVAADGSEARQISDAEGFYGLTLSPDGRMIAAAQGRQNDQPIVLVDIATGGVHPVAVPTGSYSGPSFSSPTDMLAFSGVDYARFSRTCSGAIGDQIYIANADGTDAHMLVDGMPDGAMSSIWSFDGTRIAYVRTSGIWVANLDGTDQRQITQGMNSVFSTVWSPVDDHIAFTGYENQYSAVYLVNADGSGQVKLSPEDIWASDPVRSPDGGWIASTSAGQGNSRLHIIRPDGSEHRAIDIDKGIDRVSWSPDGTWIAFTTTYQESDGPITAIHLSIINPFDDDADVHTLLRDLDDSTAPVWSDSQTTDP